MTTEAAADGLVRVIQQLVALCRRYDPRFEQSAALYAESALRLSLDNVPEGEIDRVAGRFGHPVQRPIDFGCAGAAPTTYTCCYFLVGRLTIYLCSKRRPATAAEIEAPAADAHQRAALAASRSDAATSSPAPSANGDPR
jgi:hypothetical protein